MLYHLALAAVLATAPGLCASIAPRANQIKPVNLFLFTREDVYPRNYFSDPIGLLPAGGNPGQAVCALENYNQSFPTYTFYPDKKNKAKNGANSGILLYDAESNGVKSLDQQPVVAASYGRTFQSNGANPQILFVGGGNAPVSFFYNYGSQDFGVITQPSAGKQLQQFQFFVCMVVYEGQEAVQRPNIVFTPTGAYPGAGCENITLIASL